MLFSAPCASEASNSKASYAWPTKTSFASAPRVSPCSRNALESHVGCLLVFELPQLHGSNLLEHGGVARNEVAYLHETVHDADAYVDRRVAAQYRRRHRDALLCEYSGHIAPPGVLFPQFRCIVAIDDLRLSASSLVNLKQAWFRVETVIRKNAVPSDLNWCLKMMSKADSFRKRFGVAHNPKVGGSNPPPATMNLQVGSRKASDLFLNDFSLARA